MVDEINIFDGQQNRITFEQVLEVLIFLTYPPTKVYTKTFKCTYQLQMYPFDTQVHTIGRNKH